MKRIGHVGVLVQENVIPEDIKDAKTRRNLLYSIGEIIHIGMNQATYVALKEMIKPKDFLNIESAHFPNNSPGEDGVWRKDIKRYVKEHIRNKSISIYPNNPVYVNRVKNGLQKDVLKIGSEEDNNNYLEHNFCLFHVMVRTLKYTTELVVDISGNSLQALFWLGAAHGSDIYAITVQHAETDNERFISPGSSEKKPRNIFDVAGLWTAILHSYDTEGFYRQLTLVQLGIEQHTKLMVKDIDNYENRMVDFLYKTENDLLEEWTLGIQSNSCNETTGESGNSVRSSKLSVVENLLNEKEQSEAQALESYYRDRFWKPMLRYNRLRIYMPQVDDVDSEDGDPRLHIVKWDVDAIAALSHYLSKRKLIGEYNFKTLPKDTADSDAKDLNFICVGDAAKPLEQNGASKSLAEYISSKISGNHDGIKGYNRIHKRDKIPQRCPCKGSSDDNNRVYKGFSEFSDSKGESFYTQMPRSTCFKCSGPASSQTATSSNNRFYSAEELANVQCTLSNSQDMLHLQIAQLILWREVSSNDSRIYFRSTLTGASGPATLALATLLVDDEQKQEILQEVSDNNKTMLSKLQESIRSKFIEVFLKKLDEMLDKPSMKVVDQNGNIGDPNDEQKRDYFSRIKYASAMYLSTVLYRYFLPILSKEDEYRIYNGMETYVAYMMAAGVSPFALHFPHNEIRSFNSVVTDNSVEQSMNQVKAALKQTLSSFRGVEAFYQVKVSVSSAHPESQRDTRKVIGITELDVHNSIISPVNCIFVYEDSEDDDAT